MMVKLLFEANYILYSYIYIYMNKDKNQNVFFNAGNRDAKNCADIDYVNTMNEMQIKASKKY